MKTYTIVATDTREMIDGNYLSLQLYLIPEADIEISRDGWATSAVLKAWVWIGMNLLSPTLRVKGTEAKTISIYNWAFAVKFEWNRFGWANDYTEFEADWTLKMVWNATVYNDIYTQIASAKIPASAYPDRTPFSTNLNSYVFKINDYADLWTMEMLHDYKEWSDIEVHLHLATNWSDTTVRKAKYVIYYSRWCPNDWSNQFSAEASLTAEVTIAANVLDKSAFYLSMWTISWVGMKIWCQLKTRIKRIAWTWTEPTNWPFLWMVWVHYQKDTLWSRTINVK